MSYRLGSQFQMFINRSHCKVPDGIPLPPLSGSHWIKDAIYDAITKMGIPYPEPGGGQYLRDQTSKRSLQGSNSFSPL